jgi:hypothetical protein
MTRKIRPTKGWACAIALIFGSTVLAPFGAATAQTTPSRSHPVTIDPGFESALSLEEVEQIARSALSVPINTVTQDSTTGGAAA